MVAYKPPSYFTCRPYYMTTISEFRDSFHASAGKALAASEWEKRWGIMATRNFNHVGIR